MTTGSPIPAPQYTDEQIAHGFSRAQGQCELHDVNSVRCTQPATSHVLFLMWVNGGEPPMDNFVATCEEHGKKYPKGLSFLRSIRLIRSRSSYFPQGESAAPSIITAALHSASRNPAS